MLNLSDIRFSGPALPEPFVRFELEKELKDLLPKTTGEAGRELGAAWDTYRRHLRDLVSQGGPIRVRNAIIEPLLARLGYTSIEEAGEVATREGSENGGWLLTGPNGKLRVWTAALGDDLDAPTRRGHAYRFSHLRIAQRVLLATNERLGLLTNGVELRLLISDPARTDSQIEIPVESHWKRNRDVPDSFRLVLALCAPEGVKLLPNLIEKARLKQTGVTKELRKQARQAVELFVQDLLDHPANQAVLAGYPDKEQLAKDLWHEGLINIFRLLFILKMESVGDPARVFSFASTSLWRNTYSPSVALAKVVRDVLDRGAQTGRFLEDGLRALYRMFTDGLTATEINVKPLGGALFGPTATPLLSQLQWGEHAVAHLLDRLLWTPKQRGTNARERVHYGPLTVQDLGRVYESLIELDSGITTQAMCRLRRSKLEVVVPVEQGAKYRKDFTAETTEDAEDDPASSDDYAEASEEEAKGKKTKIEWIEEIPPGRFFLRVGLGRKASGSYYTPDSFVKFLVQETLGPLCAERSPKDDPQPLAILGLKVADIAMGSGHFLFEACDFLADRLYEACRQCDELAMKAEAAISSGQPDTRNLTPEHWRSRVLALPDPNDELMAYLPSRAPEDGNVGFSAAKALALCKRLVAVHCLYGVDLNPLAVELAKLSLWIETHAEGLPLTFLDHRFVVGNSLTGPFFDHLLKYPGTQQPIDDLFTQGLKAQFTATLQAALREVHDLEATVGINLGELEAKKAAKARMDALLDPFKLAARAWSGGVMLGPSGCDDTAYLSLIKAVAVGGDGRDVVAQFPTLGKMVEIGLQSLEFDLTFPDVFFRTGKLDERSGFDVVLGNPPWDAVKSDATEFFAGFDVEYLALSSKVQRESAAAKLLANSHISERYADYTDAFDANQRIHDAIFVFQRAKISGQAVSRQLDTFRLCTERSHQVLKDSGWSGLVLSSGFHTNSGAAPVRQMLRDKSAIKAVLVFRNDRRLFEIATHLKFDLLVFKKAKPDTHFVYACNLIDEQCLFTARDSFAVLSLEDWSKLSPDFLVLPEVACDKDLSILIALAPRHGRATLSLAKAGICLAREVNMDAGPKVIGQGVKHGSAVLLTGREIDFYAANMSAASYHCLPEGIGSWGKRIPFFRLALKRVVTVASRGKIVGAVLPPAVLTSVYAEASAATRANSRALSALSTLNSFAADYLIGPRVKATLNLFMLDDLPWVTRHCPITAHGVLRLISAASAYAPLWTEQLGDAWREAKPKHTWPVLAGDDERWAVRAAIDAVVAEAYGLTREQYAHVLSTFSHKSYPNAPTLCLACFDDLKQIGLEAFTKKHDPYWDIPLNESLPKPVIDLPEIHRGEAGTTEYPTQKRARKKSAMVVKESPGDYGPLFNR